MVTRLRVARSWLRMQSSGYPFLGSRNLELRITVWHGEEGDED